MSVLRKPVPSEEYLTLQRARIALMGEDRNQNNGQCSMFDADVVSFAHGEGIRRPYPEAVAAIKASLDDPDSFPIENYMFLKRHGELEAAIAREMQRIGVPSALSENVVIDAGTSRLIIAALELMTEPGDVVITYAGYYHPLATWCAYRRLKLIVLPTDAGADHVPDPEKLEETIENTSNVRPPVLVLFNPSISGAICDAVTRDRFADIILKHNMWVIEDALFANCEFDETDRSARLAASSASNHVLTVAGASKLHGLANMRTGWGCGPAWLIDELRAYVTSNAASIPHLSQVAALGALKAPDNFLKRNTFEVQTRLALLAQAITQINAELKSETGINNQLVEVAHQPKAGHSLLLDFQGFVDALRSAGLAFSESADLTTWFLQECKVAFAPAQSHGFSGFVLRANIASIGTSFTYPSSLSMEREWTGQWQNSSNDVFDEQFEQGRKLITDAIHRRVKPAMLRALGKRSTNSGMATTFQPKMISSLSDVLAGTEVVFLDVWGVLTDGITVFDGVERVLQELKGQGVPTILISNTTRRGFELATKLEALGIHPSDYTGIVTGGDLGFQCAKQRRVADKSFGANAFLLGRQPGGHWVGEARLNPVAEISKADVLVGVGVLDDDGITDEIHHVLTKAAERNLPFLVTNADTTVRIGDRTYVASGALAPIYRNLGGSTHVFGKPAQQIYQNASRAAAKALGRFCISADTILAIGDSLATDIKGAQEFGAKTLLVTATGTHGPDLHIDNAVGMSRDAFERLCDEHAAAPDLIMRELTW